MPKQGNNALRFFDLEYVMDHTFSNKKIIIVTAIRGHHTPYIVDKHPDCLLPLYVITIESPFNLIN